MRPLTAVILAFLLTATAQADGEGRYEAVVLHEGARGATGAQLNPKVFILDTVEGHMWVWSDGELVQGLPGQTTFGTVLTYEGKLKVGRAMGEVVDRQLKR
jgi:hypothetical protein